MLNARARIAMRLRHWTRTYSVQLVRRMNVGKAFGGLLLHMDIAELGEFAPVTECHTYQMLRIRSVGRPYIIVNKNIRNCFRIARSNLILVKLSITISAR